VVTFEFSSFLGIYPLTDATHEKLYTSRSLSTIIQHTLNRACGRVSCVCKTIWRSVFSSSGN